MSDKNSTQNQLGNTELPSDLLTQTLGSAYGVGEYPDMEYGMGVLEGVQAQEAVAVPTGLSLGSAEGLDLRGLMASEELADLTWLDPTQLQDPERLPKSTNDTVIPELEEAWGVNRRTDGIQIVSRDLEQARYEDSLDGDGVSEKKASVDQMRSVVAHAMRRSAEGQDIDLVIKQALEGMGEEMGRVAAPLRRVRAEHGLAGNVFIRASAYPGYSTGKWSKQARNFRARYIIVSQKSLDGATWIENGRCQYSGKIAVTEVPWKQAEEYYSRRFDRRVASEYVKWSGTPQDRLRRAFLHTPKKQAPESWLPEHSDMSREAFLRKEVFSKVESRETRHKNARAVEARGQISRWAREGLLSRSAHKKILESGASPERQVQAAVSLIRRAGSQDYSGTKNSGVTLAQVERRLRQGQDLSDQQRIRLEAHATKLEASGAAREAARQADRARALAQGQEWLRKGSFSGAPNQSQKGDLLAQQARRQADQERVAKHQKGLDRIAEDRREAEAQAAARKVAKVIKSGLRGRRLVEEIKRLVPREIVPRAAKYIDPLLISHNALAEPEGPASYEGTRFTRTTPKQASNHETVGTVQAALRYVRKTMSEGFAGHQLDSLLTNRFSAKVLGAMSESLHGLRQAHEGGAGFLYVDAEAYASLNGVTGCQSGGLKHRANQIPAVLQMERCGECTLAQTLPDGTRKCSVYNKVLLEDAAGSEMDQMRSANLKVANMSDGEQTQSMFSPSYDPDEFGLRNSNLEGVSPDFPEHEKLAEIMFGGWNL
jgi:hypothetical protein